MKIDFKIRNVLILVIMLCIIFIQEYKTHTLKEVRLTYLNEGNEMESRIHFIAFEGEGDSFLIESNGLYGLVDASSPNDDSIKAVHDSKKNVNYVISYLEKLNITHLDFIVGTHSHSENIGGIPMIAEAGFVDSSTKYYYREYLGAIYEDNNTNNNNMEYYKKAITAMEEKSAQLIEITNKFGNDVSFQFGQFKIEFLNTWVDEGEEEQGENSNSIGMLISRGDTKVFLASDIEAADEYRLIDYLGEIDVLKMGHYGQKTSSTYTFINKIKPKSIIVPFNDIHSYTESIVAYLNSDEYKNLAKHDCLTYYYSSNLVKNNLAIILNVRENGYNFEKEGSLINTKNIDWQQWRDSRIGWQNEGNVNFYIDTTTYEPITGLNMLEKNGEKKWYYFDTESKRMKTGIQCIEKDGEKKWCYFSEDKDNKGAMEKGWQYVEINGEKNWYYFNEITGFIENILKKGDVDQDGKITSYDAFLILKYSVQLDFNEQIMNLGDIDEDESITSYDAYCILKLSVQNNEDVNYQKQLVWSDEFDETELNDNIWSYVTRPPFNNESQKWTENNTEIKDGNLVIKAEYSKTEGFTSSEITSKGKKTLDLSIPGRIEASISLPDCSAGAAPFPAFWMLGNAPCSDEEQGIWPIQPEIDIMEGVNNIEKIYGTTHGLNKKFFNTGKYDVGNLKSEDFEGWLNQSGLSEIWNDEEYDLSKLYTSLCESTSIENPSDFHTYALEWHKDLSGKTTIIDFYLDNKKYHSVNLQKEYGENSVLFDSPNYKWYVILNLSIGGDWAGTPTSTEEYPLSMKIDYVRYFKYYK